MGPLSAARRYWFDDAPLTPPPPAEASAWQDVRKGWAAGGKSRLGAVLKADVKAIAGDLFKSKPDLIEAFAEANGLGYQASGYVAGKDLPGLVFQGRMGDRRSAVTWGESPYVEFANYQNGGEDAGEGSHWGYVAIRHGRDLPHVVFDACANDSGSGAADSGKSVSSLGEGSWMATPALKSSRTKLVPLELGPSVEASRFVTYVSKGDEAAARRLLDGSTLALVQSLVESFDVEFVDGWVFLYGYHFDVSTDEADRWAWVFSVASQVLDQVEAWGGPAAPSEAPFYTRERVGRPASLAELPQPWSRGATGAWNAVFGRDGLLD